MNYLRERNVFNNLLYTFHLKKVGKYFENKKNIKESLKSQRPHYLDPRSSKWTVFGSNVLKNSSTIN